MDSEVFARIRDYLADQLEVEPEKSLVAAPRSCTPPLDSPRRKKAHFRA